MLGDLLGGRKTAGNSSNSNPTVGGGGPKSSHIQVTFKSDHWLAADVAHFCGIVHSDNLT